MSRKISFTTSRFFTAIVVAALMASLLPFAVTAAVPSITIKEVNSGVSVTVQAANFPANIDITVRMDKVGNYALGGIVVGTLNSGTGSFDASFTIPPTLKNESIIAIRMDGTGGWYSYNWFENKTGVAPSPTPTSAPSIKPYIEVIGVKVNDSITVQARRFPASQTFQIRIGTFKNFFKDFVVAGTVNSGSGGDFQFSVKLPVMQTGVDLFTIRLDSPQKIFAYNVFKHITSGTSGPVPSPTPGPTVTPVSGTCQVISTTPTKILALREDFDAVWTVKNTTNNNWDMSEVDFKFISGTQMQKRGSLFDLAATVKPGETITIVVDMTAPATAGTYATNWAVMHGGTTLCTLPLTVTAR